LIVRERQGSASNAWSSGLASEQSGVSDRQRPHQFTSNLNRTPPTHWSDWIPAQWAGICAAHSSHTWSRSRVCVGVIQTLLTSYVIGN